MKTLERCSHITGAILAGGRSTRMGTDKALLTIEGQPVIQRVGVALHNVVERCILIADNASPYAFLDLPSYPDIYKNAGPLAGIHSALTHSRSDSVFILSCDLPLVTSEMIFYIIQNQTARMATVVANGNCTQPLCGVYRRRLLPILADHLQRGQYSVLRFLEVIDPTIIDVSSSAETPFPALLNMNTPEEYRSVCSTLAIQ